jgi:hypothetical protein
MNFSAILDISSFFIGMIINLLLIALICYYFKRKYENLEIAQNEQAKVLYQLLQQNSSPKVMNLNDVLKSNDSFDKPKKSSLSDLDSDTDSDSESDTDADLNADSDSDSDFNETELKSNKMKNSDKIKTINLINLDKNHSEIEEIQVQTEKVEKIDVEKVDVEKRIKVDIEPETKSESEPKESKDELVLNLDELDEIERDIEKDYSKMSIKQLKEILTVKGIVPTKMKKNEMIELIEKSSITIDEPEIES